MREIKKLKTLDADELFTFAKDIQAPYNLVKQTAELGRLPVVNFAAGGVATPAGFPADLAADAEAGRLRFCHVGMGLASCETAVRWESWTPRDAV